MRVTAARSLALSGSGAQATRLYKPLTKLLRRAGGWALAPERALVFACAGLGIFVVVGLLGPLFGGNFLDYSVLPLWLETPEVRVVGSMAIEVGVAVTVTGVLTLIFDALAEVRNDG